MPTIESYLQNAQLPQAAKADAWEAYQAQDHDSFVSSVGKLNVPQNVKADIYEMRFGGKSQPASAPPAGPPSMIENIENMAGKATSYIKNLAAKPVPTVSDQDRAQFPKTSAAFQSISDFAGKPLVPQGVSDYLSDVSQHASTIPGHPRATAILTGTDRGMGKVAQSLTTPANIGTIAATMIPGVGEAAGLGFGLQGGAQALREGAAAKHSYDQGNWEDAAEHGTSSVVNAAFAGLGLKGSIHDETPLANPQSPEVPVADHPLDRNESVTPLQGRLFPESEHTVPTASSTPPSVSDTQQLSLDFHPGQRDLFAQHGADYNPPTVNPSPAKPSTTPEQMQLMPWQGNLFPKEAEDSTPHSTTPDVQSVLNPMQGRLFSVKGEALPPQVGDAGPMSPEAEKVSKAAQDKVQPEPTSPSVATPPEGPTGSDERVSKLEDSIRTQTGQVMRLNQLVKTNQIHASLERAIDETQSAQNPRARSVGPGITPEDQKIVSIALGEKVGRMLTPDQVDKAYALRGKVLGDTPVIQNRTDANAATLKASREAMGRDLATTTDPVLREKLQNALQPGEDGKLKPMVYKPQRKSALPVELAKDHPEAPFAPRAFGAQYPDITMKNLEAALGYKPRALDLGMGDPELQKLISAQKADVTAEGKGTVNANTDAFTYETQHNPKGYNGDLKANMHQYLEGSTQAMSTKIASDLRNNVKAYQSLRDASKPSPLIDQLKGLHPDSLPKEVQELVKPTESKASSTNASASNGVRPKTPEARNTPEAPKGTTLGKAKSGLVSLYDHFQKNAPEHLESVQTIIQKAVEHFGNDTDGRLLASYHALKVFKQGIDEGNDWAMRDAIKVIRRLRPLDESTKLFDTTSGATTVNTRGGSTFYSGIDPTLAKGVAKGVAKAAGDVRNYVAPKFTDDDLAVSSEFLMHARLTRYEKMTPANRSAYSKHIFDDANDRLAVEGDPDGSRGFQERLAALRKTVPRTEMGASLKHWLSGEETDTERLGRDTAADLRAKNGTRARQDLQARAKLEDASAKVDSWNSFESRDFTHKMELGLDQGDPFKNQLAGMLREVLDNARNAITAANGDFEEYLKDYFPHIWANVGKGQELYHQMSGLSGNESFTKSRVLDTINQGHANGLALVTENPIKLVLMRTEQMHRYAMKETLVKNMKESGAAQFVERGKPVPAGLDPLNDLAFQSTGGAAGQYFAPKEVAKVFNRFTSKGLAGKNIAGLPVYDMFKQASNVMNHAELSWSGLHGFFGGVNSVLTDQARGTAKFTNALLAGDSTGMRDGMKAIMGSYNVWGRIKLGSNLIAHIRDSDQFQEMASLGDAWERAGNRVGQGFDAPSFADRAKNSWKRAADDSLSPLQRSKAGVSGLLNTMGRVMDLPTGWIMSKLIPNLKAGHFAVQAGDILANAEGKRWSDVTQDLQRLSDTMDDRFGQLVYDNLSMDKMAKDIMAITMRSPGWNIGTARAGYHGLADLAKGARDAATKKQRFQITDRTAYLGVLLANTMMVNGALNLAMTGQMPHGADYFFARTGSKDDNGEENRIMPKLYTYDYIGFARHPIDTALHKINPLIMTLTDLHANKSFYGREVFDPGAGVGMKLAQSAWYATKQLLPFTVSNFQESSTRGEGVSGSLFRSATGILPAPKWAGRSDAENLAAEYHADSRAQGGEEGDAFDTHQKYVQLQSDVKNGTVTPEELSKRVNSGEIPVSFLDHIYDKQQTPNLERWTKSLSAKRAMEVFDRATPEEKQRLIPVLVQKMDTLNPSEIPAYAQKINDAQHHPDTHVFSVSQWSAAHPGEDAKAAETHAHQQGYEVHP